MINPTATLQNFLKKYQIAQSYKSKELRLTIQEADELNNAIALFLLESRDLSNKIIELQDKILEVQKDIQITGGKF